MNAMASPPARSRALATRSAFAARPHAGAAGALAVGAFALGAVAVGCLAIGRLAVGRARIRRLELDTLVVRKLKITEQLQVPPAAATSLNGSTTRSAAMKPRISLVTLGVDDLRRAVAFYRDGLGFSTKGVVGTEGDNTAVAFFNLESDLKLALWPRKSLAADSGVPLHAASGTEFSLAHNVDSQAEVDAVMRQVERAGAAIVKPAQSTAYGGYAGYFQDPDGHLWEVAFNPGFASLG